MYHSITFTDKNGTEKNTWTDWHLIPKSRPLFNPPAVKTKYLEIPGTDAVIDLSEAVKGYPVYENREGSFEFIVENGHSQWYEVYSACMGFLNGCAMKAVLEDDLSHYYEGRFYVDQWKSDVHRSVITVGYSVKPYKRRIISSLDDWLWDPFNFETGVIQCDVFCDIKVDDSTSIDLALENLIGRMPLCPDFIVSDSDDNGVTIHFYNEELGIDLTRTFYNGRNNDREIIFSNISTNNAITLNMQGYGKVSVDFRSGGL